MAKALVNKKMRLEKSSGKGGWTYVVLDNIPEKYRSRGGHVKVKGRIDSYLLQGYRLMPISEGRFLLPVKSEIRKKIKKQEGDTVEIVLYPDTEPLQIPDEFVLCLHDDPLARQTFYHCTEGQQKAFISWIFSAKKTQTKADRMAKTLEMLARGEKYAGQ